MKVIPSRAWNGIGKRMSALSLKAKFLLATWLLVGLCAGIGVFGERIIERATNALYGATSSASVSWLNLTAQNRVEVIAAIWVAVADYQPNAPVGTEEVQEISTALQSVSQNLSRAEADSVGEASMAETFKKMQGVWDPLAKEGEELVRILTAGKVSRADVKERIAQFSDKSLELSDLIAETLDEKKKESLEINLVAQRLQSTNRIFLAAALVLCAALAAVMVLYIGGLSRKMLGMAANLASSSQEIAVASKSTAEIGRQLNDRVNRQAAFLTESVASITEIGAMLGRTVDLVNEVHQRMSEANSQSERGVSASRRMEDAMEEIHRASRDVEEMREIMREISTKAKIINEIAFKTQLISFNASIEAARAGQHGRGFAVVAQEVGELATSSAGAVVEISQLLQTSAEKIQQVTQQTRSKVQQGSDVQKLSNEAFQNISRQIQILNEKVSDVAKASQEQQTGLSNYGEAISRLDEDTRHNAAAARQLLSWAVQLQKQVEGLGGEVRDLNSLVQGVQRLEKVAVS